MLNLLAKHFGSKTRNRSRRPAKRLFMESLERRELFSTDLLSAFALGNTTDEMKPEQVAIDSVGNRYVTGSFGGTVDFEPGSTRVDNSDVLTSNGSRDGFVAKYSPNDTLLWLKQFGGLADTGFDDTGTGVALAGSGNVIVTGRFSGLASFAGSSLTSVGGIDGLVAKLNSSTGATQWVTAWGGSNDERNSDLAVDASGNAYVTTVTNVLGNSYTAIGMGLQKYNSSGTKVWQKDFNAVADSYPIHQSTVNDVAVDSSGNVVIVGSVKGTIDFDPSNQQKIASSRSTTAYAAKYDSSGAIIWLSPFYGSGPDAAGGFSFANAVAIDDSSYVIVGGNYEGTVDFNPGKGITWLQGGGGFIAKLSPSNGALSWARPLVQTLAPGYGYITTVTSLATDATGGLYATGSFAVSVDFDPGVGIVSKSSNGNRDVFVLNLSSSGQFGWVETFGGASDDIARDLAIDSVGNISLIGVFTGAVDFDPNTGTYELSSPGTKLAGFVARYRRS